VLPIPGKAPISSLREIVYVFTPTAVELNCTDTTSPEHTSTGDTIAPLIVVTCADTKEEMQDKVIARIPEGSKFERKNADIGSHPVHEDSLGVIGLD
jgi:hypothetical protein